MNIMKGVLARKSSAPYRIVREQLNDTGTDLTSFYFRYGGNFYVFSYQNEGTRKHTVVDAGDLRYRNQILSILLDNGVNPVAIERIIITHRHHDHCGLADLLAKESGAKILVHSNFKHFVEGQLTELERRWIGSFDPTKLGECDIEYLPASNHRDPVDIGGVSFPSLVEPIRIGDAGKLLILASPESTLTHAPDQIIALYSPRDYPQTNEEPHNGRYRPTDEILFSGDLWLMTGPLFDWRMIGLSFFFRLSFYLIKVFLSGKVMPRRFVMEQDSQAKEALKGNFCLIRVKPGHGEEFIGSRIIPHSLPADRDLLKELGYSVNDRRSILRSRELAPKVATLNEQAYTSFIQEVLSWEKLGYKLDEISELLVRIYREQRGGGPLVTLDRKQRRVRIKTTLSRLKKEEAETNQLHQLAKLTLPKLENIS
ncbi:MBL fold metallo-hydrolase [Chloroflexota bacterium]